MDRYQGIWDVNQKAREWPILGTAPSPRAATYLHIDLARLSVADQRKATHDLEASHARAREQSKAR